jgi:glycosyltransferase involved in cell wall biosynthesis
MKICFVSHDSGIQGAELALLDLAVNLKNIKGHEVHIVIPSCLGGLLDKVQRAGIGYSVIPYKYWMSGSERSVLRSMWKLVINLIAVLRFRRLLKAQHIDLVYSNSSTVCVGAFAAWTLSIPHLWHIHELAEADFGYAFDFGSKYSFWLMNRMTMVFIVVSDALKHQYDLSLPPEKIHRIYQSLTVDCSGHNEGSDPDTTASNCAVLGRISSGKRQSDAILAVADLAKRGVFIKLWLIGNHDPVYLQYLRNLVIENNVEALIVFRGHIDRPFDLLRKMDFSVVCSASEAFGRVTIESMLCNVPVIGCDSGATSELIQHGVTGLLYPAKDICALANCIETFIKDPKLRRDVANRARVFAAREFSVSKYVNTVDTLMRSLVQQPARKLYGSNKREIQSEVRTIDRSPDVRPFFLVGTAKAGTTAVAEWLSKSPEIELTSPKETHYFDGQVYDRNNGFSYFKNKFGWSSPTAKYFGEIATSYLFVPYVADRIRHSCGDNVPIIILLRNPVERAFSDWWMMYSAGIEKLSFADAIEENIKQDSLSTKLLEEGGSNIWQTHLACIAEQGRLKFRTYIDYGMYAAQVLRYFDLFGSTNVKVFFFEEIFEATSSFPTEMEMFLELNANSLKRQIDVINEKYNNKTIGSLSRIIGRHFPHFTMSPAVKRLLHGIGTPPVADETSIRLLENIFIDDSKKLEVLLGRSLPYTISSAI